MPYVGPKTAGGSGAGVWLGHREGVPDEDNDVVAAPPISDSRTWAHMIAAEGDDAHAGAAGLACSHENGSPAGLVWRKGIGLMEFGPITIPGILIRFSIL